MRQDVVLHHEVENLAVSHGQEIGPVVQVEGHVHDGSVQVVDLSSCLLEDDVARRYVDDPDGAGVPGGVHVVSVGLSLGHDGHLQGGASERAGRLHPLGKRDGVRMGAVALIYHHEKLVEVSPADVHGLPVLVCALALLGAVDVAGGQVAEVSQTDVGEAGLPYGQRDGVVRDRGDGVGGSVYGVHDERLLRAVVDEAYLLAEDVERDAVALYVHQSGVLGNLIDLRRRSSICAHADLLPLGS